jgi:hypothetical protein
METGPIHKPQQQDALIQEKRTEIRDAMHNLGRAIQSGEEREFLHWVSLVVWRSRIDRSDTTQCTVAAGGAFHRTPRPWWRSGRSS